MSVFARGCFAKQLSDPLSESITIISSSLQSLTFHTYKKIRDGNKEDMTDIQADFSAMISLVQCAE
jgi:hypothetical protein